MSEEKTSSKAEELNKRGLIFVQTEQSEEALKYFNRAIEADRNFMDAYYNKAVVHLALDQVDDAIKAIDSILIKNGNDGEAYFEKGNILFYYKNDIKTAVELYNKAMYLGVKNERSYYSMALCMEASSENEEAIKWLDRAIILDNKNVQVISKKAEILAYMLKYNEAINCYDSILKIQVDNEEAYHFKTVLLSQIGKTEEAFETIQAAESILGKRGILEYDKCLLYEKEKKQDEALTSLNEAISLSGKNTMFLSKKASILILMEKIDEAKKVYDESIEIEPDNMEVYFSKANLLMLNKEYEEASKIYNIIIEKSDNKNPYRINSYYYKALCFENMHQEEKAIDAYKEAIENYNLLILNYPYDLQLHVLKANSLRDTRKYEEAEELYEYVIDLNKNMPEVYLMRAKNRIGLGKENEAKNDVNTAIKIAPEFERIVRLDEDLNKFL
jgi:tetratricopeptide (TPR) repeat protein